MKLLQDKWPALLRLQAALTKDKHITSQKEANEASDFYATNFFMQFSRTIIIPTPLMLELMQSVDKVDCYGALHLPYPVTLIQFTRPIPEHNIMVHMEQPVGHPLLDHDSIEGFLLCNPYQGEVIASQMSKFYDRIAMNSIALFTSTAVSRVAWLDPEGGKAKPTWEAMALPIEGWRKENKVRLMRIAYLIDLFLNAPNVTVDLVKPDVKVNRKREAKGKARLPEYHVVSIKKLQGVYAGEGEKGQGKEHSHMYPVRGHFRRYKHLNKPVWIPNHYRGLKHGFASMRPEIYQVRPADVDTHIQPREE